MFDEGDGWFDALEDEESDLLEFGLDTILSPMSDYSDLWLYHPGVKNAYGEPTLYYLSHEGGDIDNPQDWNIGSLFLARAARSLDLKVTLPTPAPFAGAPAPAEWWNGLSDAWKAALRDQWGVSGPDSADKAFKKRDLYISDKFQVESLEPARILRKLQSIACEFPGDTGPVAPRGFARIVVGAVHKQGDHGFFSPGPVQKLDLRDALEHGRRRSEFCGQSGEARNARMRRHGGERPVAPRRALAN